MTDAERLDWLEQLTEADAIVPLVSEWRWKGEYYRGGLRDAIDAAMRVEPIAGPLSGARSDKATLPAASAAPVEAVEVLRATLATAVEHMQMHNEEYRHRTPQEFIDAARRLVAQPPQAVQEVRLLTSDEANPILDEIVGNYPVDLAEQVQREFCRANGLKLAAAIAALRSRLDGEKK